MDHRYIDCRVFPNEANCSIAISADSNAELLETTVQHVASMYKHIDSPELRAQLQIPFQDGTPTAVPPKTTTT